MQYFHSDNKVELTWDQVCPSSPPQWPRVMCAAPGPWPRLMGAGDPSHPQPANSGAETLCTLSEMITIVQFYKGCKNLATLNRISRVLHDYATLLFPFIVLLWRCKITFLIYLCLLWEFTQFSCFDKFKADIITIGFGISNEELKLSSSI